MKVEPHQYRARSGTTFPIHAGSLNVRRGIEGPKMRYLRFSGLLGLFLGIGLFSASNANAQRVTFGVGFGGPVYYGAAPVCGYGYYDYYPYACAPYGY